MAVVFSKLSGKNDVLYKDIETTLTAIIQDTDTEENKYEEIVKALFNVKKSNKWAEKIAGVTSFGNYEIVNEGEIAPLDEIQAGFDKLIYHSSFFKKFVVTAEMAEDGLLDASKVSAANFVKSYKRSKAELATRALATEGATFAYGSKVLDKTTGDGVGLFNTAHPGKKDGVATQSNVFTNAFGNDTTILNRLANIGRNFQNDSGFEQGYTFDTIIIPGNTPALEDTVKRIIRSELVVGSSNNDVNTQKGLWQLVVNTSWIAANGTAPYIIMSSEANKEIMGNQFYDRTPLTIRSEVDIDTHNLLWTARARMSAGFGNWRQCLMGGASAGTTLT